MRAALNILLLVLVTACSAERGLGDGGASVHGPGILDPASDNFHGKVAERAAWDVAVCMTCHDQTKTDAAPPCAKCHADGPSGCTSCHKMPPMTGAHLKHAGDGAPASCAKCHPVPTNWTDPGHFAAKAILAFAPIAGPNATFDGTRCQNVACHGATLADGGATNTAPAWNGGPAEATCGTCHGAPPATHVQQGGYACVTCHPAGSPHVDGTLNIGRTTGCDGCHGTAASPAPPVDLSGNTLTTALTVGAHQAHLLVPTKLRGPIACITCHAVPAMITTVGHIDSPAPAEVNAEIGWDRTTATCTASCHGTSRPTWTSTGAAVCGACHGIPPNDASHTPTMQLSDCATCHPGSVDATGYPIITSGPNGPTSEHINGHVDL